MSVDADGDGHLDDDYVPAAPGIDPGVARFSKTPKSTTTDFFRPIYEDVPTKDGRLHNKFMPGYSGFVPKEMDIKTSGGQWTQPKFLEVEPAAVRPATASPLPKAPRTYSDYQLLCVAVAVCFTLLSRTMSVCARRRPTCHLRTLARMSLRGQEHHRAPLSSLVMVSCALETEETTSSRPRVAVAAEDKGTDKRQRAIWRRQRAGLATPARATR